MKFSSMANTFHELEPKKGYLAPAGGQNMI